MYVLACITPRIQSLSIRSHTRAHPRTIPHAPAHTPARTRAHPRARPRAHFPAQKTTPKPDRKIHLLKGPRQPEKHPKTGQGLQAPGSGGPGPPGNPLFGGPKKGQKGSKSLFQGPLKGPFSLPGWGPSGGAGPGPGREKGPKSGFWAPGPKSGISGISRARAREIPREIPRAGNSGILGSGILGFGTVSDLARGFSKSILE